MRPLWLPEIEVDEALARSLIRAQFPEFADSAVHPLARGWDNAAFIFDERFIFRFPLRAAAAPLLEREIEFMPLIAQRLYLNVPRPTYAGVPQHQYPWRFAGYEVIAGSTACGKKLTPQDRRVLAEDLAHFLRTLHGIELSSLPAGLPEDDEIAKDDPFGHDAYDEPPGGQRVVVHGDLYARHLLLDESNRLCGVIDWGDLHCGHPAVDLSVVHMMVPASDHAVFLDAYGTVDERTWRFARRRARNHAIVVLDYSTRVGDEALEAAARTALHYIDG